MEIGLIRKIKIDNEMQQAYLSYAMSTIVARALPDARDGLKPVQRRILYAMHDMGLRTDSAFKKSARIVGEVLGKYHPHGDASVYEAMARLAQDFSLRYTLVDGQGNFGSIDGDQPAAMRYTEARLAAMSGQILADIEKDTVDFTPNFDDTLTEPSVLPSAVPNLLVNGATGIAVGMATSIPPHNLGEVCDALIFMLDRWSRLDDVTIEDLMKFVRGPDFPTGGVIVQAKDEAEGLAAAYGAGRGRITVQAKMHVEDMGRGKSRLIITELPYQTNKSSLIERIADLARGGLLEGLADLRDESDRQGMRVVIELQKTADPSQVIRELYRRTPLQSTFSIINLALVNGEPRLLTLKQALRVFLDHRQEVIRRRSEHDLARARERAHILEGLLKALQFLDEVIKIIRAARDTEEARAKLVRRFKLSEAQTTAILDMPLKRLAALERRKIEDEYKEKAALIKRLESLLGSPKKIRESIQEELRGLKQRFADARRTQIVEAGSAQGARQAMTTADLAPDRRVWVTITASGLVSRTPENRQPKADPAPLAMLSASTRDLVYLMTLKGRAVTLPVFSLPEKEDPADGTPWASVSSLDPNARVAAAVAVSNDMLRRAEAARPAGGEAEAEGPAEGVFLFLATAGGMVKRVSVADLPGLSAQVYSVINVAENDGLVGARLTTGAEEVLLVTAQGRAIRFREAEVRPMGLGAQGVMGIKPGATLDPVIGMDVVQPKAQVFMLTDEGMGKRTDMKEFPTQGRYGVGVTAAGLAGKQRLAGMVVGQPDERVIVVTSKGTARTLKIEAAGRKRRPARGSGVVSLKSGETVARVLRPLAQVELPSEASPEPKRRRGAAAKAASAKKKPAARPAARPARKSPARKR